MEAEKRLTGENHFMNHRERVTTALQHENPDRCPMQISFTPEFADRLREELHVQGKLLHNPHGGGNTYELERALDEDLILTSVGWANSYYHAGASYVDEWGIGWRATEYVTKFGKGTYTEIVSHPLAQDDVVDSYRSPDPNRPELYQEAAAAIHAYKSEYYIVGVTVTTIFETAWALRGLDQLLMDFILDPDLTAKILDIPYQYHLTAAKKLVEMGVDMIWTGDDVGAQTSMMISPSLWRQYFKPRMAEFIGDLKRINPTVKVAYHSDGVITPIIPDLIEIGLDVLNPVQPACMNPEALKKQYGQTLSFWGSIDEQYTLPFGSPDEVKREVETRLRTLGKNGGLIIGPTHHVQLDTPMENFWSMVNTIKRTPYASL
jgi:uroporphyrinogen decarboxylase